MKLIDKRNDCVSYTDNPSYPHDNNNVLQKKKFALSIQKCKKYLKADCLNLDGNLLDRDQAE